MRVLTLVMTTAFVLVLARGVVDAARSIDTILERGTTEKVEDTASIVGSHGAAFRRFRGALDENSRFALVFGPRVGRDERILLTLFSGFYLYPSIAVDDPLEADRVMVFGVPSTALLRRFRPIGESDDTWLGRRP